MASSEAPGPALGRVLSQHHKLTSSFSSDPWLSIVPTDSIMEHGGPASFLNPTPQIRENLGVPSLPRPSFRLLPLQEMLSVC